MTWPTILQELNEWLHGTIHEVVPPPVDHEEFLEQMTDEEYEAVWPFHLDFYGHPVDMEELSLWDDHDEHHAETEDAA